MLKDGVIPQNPLQTLDTLQAATKGHPSSHRGKGQEGTRRHHGRRTESFRRRDMDTVGEKPQLIPFSIAPAKLPDSSLLPRSRCGGTHSPAEYTDKAQQL